MQRFDRSSEPPPRALQSEAFSAHRQELTEFFLFGETKRAQTRAPSNKLSLDHESIREALGRLFCGKCAFCESKLSTKPYRFRPDGNASPVKRKAEAHLYYTWLSYAWENIYPICVECYPTRAEYFPVSGKRAPLPTEAQLRDYEREGLGAWRSHPPKETCLLLDPCETSSFVKHLTVDLNGSVFAHTDAARNTIEHFNLDRPDLTERRRRYLNEYFYALNEALHHGPPFALKGWSWLFNFSEMEFGGLWYLMCREIVSILTIDKKRGSSLSLARIGETIQEISRNGSELMSSEELAAQITERAIRMFPDDSYLMRTITDNPPTLTAFQLTNFKGIEKLDLAIPGAQAHASEQYEVLQPALLILGENAAGKSSILEGIALALATEEARLELQLDTSEFPLDPKLLGATEEPLSASAVVELKFDNYLQRILTITNRRYTAEGLVELPPVFAYGAFRQYRKQVRKYSSSKSIVNLFHSDKLLSNPERWLLGLNDSDFDSVVRALREILSIEGDFEVMERDFENRRCLIVTDVGHNVSNRMPLSLASSGYRSMLAMVCDIIQGLMSGHNHTVFESLETAQAIVLIDEVEAHLHPRWKIQIMAALRRALPKVTFIATTHDPLCLRGMQDGEVVVMHRVAKQEGFNSRWPVTVEQVVSLPDISRLTIEQLLTSDFFRMASTEQPSTEREFAQFADLLAAQESGKPLTEAQHEAWTRFEHDIRDALPVGGTEVQRLVQEAVVEFLVSRRQASAEKLAKLRHESKQRIVKILEAL